MKLRIDLHLTEYGYINECIYTDSYDDFLKFKIYIGNTFPECMIEVVRVSDSFILMKSIHRSILID